MEYGLLFIGVTVALLILMIVALTYATKMKRRGEREQGNARRLNDAVSMMFSHTVEVNLTNDTFILKSAKTGTRKPEKSISDYDTNSVAVDRLSIDEGYDRDDFTATFSRTALMKAYTAGEKRIKRRYKMVSGNYVDKYMIVEAFFMDDNEGDVVAMILFKEEEEVISEKLDMKKELELKDEALKKLMEEKATLTTILEEQNETVDVLTAKVSDLNSVVKEANAALEDYVTEKSSNPVRPVPSDILTSLRAAIPEIQEELENAELSFSLQIEDIPNKSVYLDSHYVNEMVIDMVKNAVNGCERGGKIYFVIKQVSGVVNGWAEYEYSCIYLGSTLSFNSEYVGLLGGKAIIDRTEDGGNVLTVRVKYEVIEEAREAADE